MALVPAVLIGLFISFTPELHPVANFSWFIGAFLAGGSYRFIARHDRASTPAVSFVKAEAE